jgi:hypothetical protein
MVMVMLITVTIIFLSWAKTYVCIFSTTEPNMIPGLPTYLVLPSLLCFLLCWEYIVKFTKVLTMYQIYHS